MGSKGKRAPVSAVPHTHSTQEGPQSTAEAAVWAVLEEARLNVKGKVIEELEGEMIGAEILNLRLKAG